MKYAASVVAEEYKEGLEDDFVYHIAIFGLFTKQECIDSGFTPNFENDKIPVLRIKDELIPIGEGDFIVKFLNGKREVCKRRDFFENYIPV